MQRGESPFRRQRCINIVRSIVGSWPFFTFEGCRWASAYSGGADALSDVWPLLAVSSATVRIAAIRFVEQIDKNGHKQTNRTG